MSRKIKRRLVSVFKLGIVITILGIWMVPSCTFDKGEVLVPSPCDSSTVKFAADVEPIIQVECLNFSCHTASNPSGGVGLHSYDLVQEEGLNGKLLCAVNWGSSCSDMPFGFGTQIDSVSISTIELWINQGACP